MGNNNKESYELLAMYTSDSASEISELVISPKKKKLKRRRRNNILQKKELNTVGRLCNCGHGTGSKLLFAVFFSSGLLCWITTLTWLACVLNSEIQRLDSTVQSVVAGNQGVPDTLQKCHSISRELQKNQTELFSRISIISQQLANFSTQVAGVSNGLNKVEKQLKASPELVNVASLSSSVASFGSQIQDLVSTTKQLKEANERLTESSHVLELNVTSLKQKVSDLRPIPASPTGVPDSDALASLTSVVNNMMTNITNINTTLSSKLQWALDDERSDSREIQSLRDMNANLSARISTLETKSNSKTNDFETISSSFNQLQTKIDGRISEMTNKVSEMEGICTKLQNSTLHLENTVDNIKSTLNLEPSPSVTAQGNSVIQTEISKPTNLTEP